MADVLTIDFHTHWSCQVKSDIPPEVLMIISTPLAEINTIQPDSTRRTLELHPWQGESYTSGFEKAAESPEIIGIGEAGLDRLRGALPLDEQLDIFRKTALLAEKLQKPLTVHCVKCFSELLAVNKELRLTIPLIVHYFRGSIEQAKQLWQHKNIVLSLPPAIYTRTDVLDFLRNNPEYLQRIVLETDDPENGDIVQHYHRIADLLKLEMQTLQKLMMQQFELIYGKKIS